MTTSLAVWGRKRKQGVEERRVELICSLDFQHRFSLFCFEERFKGPLFDGVKALTPVKQPCRANYKTQLQGHISSLCLQPLASLDLPHVWKVVSEDGAEHLTRGCGHHLEEVFVDSLCDITKASLPEVEVEGWTDFLGIWDRPEFPESMSANRSEGTLRRTGDLQKEPRAAADSSPSPEWAAAAPLSLSSSLSLSSPSLWDPSPSLHPPPYLRINGKRLSALGLFTA